jgi:hypothetical protein
LTEAALRGQKIDPTPALDRWEYFSTVVGERQGSKLITTESGGKPGQRARDSANKTPSGSA